MQPFLDINGRLVPTDHPGAMPHRESTQARKKARAVFHRALNRGDVARSDRCLVCGDKSTKLEAHHHDYNFPLQVEWLCASCHSWFHTQDTRLRGGWVGHVFARQIGRLKATGSND
jgi:hypothetical protein